MTGAERIAAERQRQLNVENWSPIHDDSHPADDLALAAATYALPSALRRLHGELPYRGLTMKRTQSVREWLWPWADEYWKPSADDRIRELEKAGALIAAEIDRLERSSSVDGGEKT